MENTVSIGLLEGLAARRSCRAFEKKPIPAEVLKAVLQDACHAPSAKNMQPWEVYVLSGTKLDTLRAASVAALKAKNTSKLHSAPVSPALTSRARALSADMASFLEKQAWDDGRSFVERSIEYFDAPAAAIICVDSPKFEIDAGLFTLALCLSAEGHGLASCILGYPLIVEHAIRTSLALPEGRNVVVTVALGYAADAPMAKFRSSRAPLEENIHFLTE